VRGLVDTSRDFLAHLIQVSGIHPHLQMLLLEKI
jgi:hypothetical protein